MTLLGLLVCQECQAFSILKDTSAVLILAMFDAGMFGRSSIVSYHIRCSLMFASPSSQPQLVARWTSCNERPGSLQLASVQMPSLSLKTLSLLRIRGHVDSVYGSFPQGIRASEVIRLLKIRHWRVISLITPHACQEDVSCLAKAGESDGSRQVALQM